METNNSIQSYLHLDIMSQDIRDLISHVTILYQHLDNQLAALTLGYLSPNLIPLHQIKNSLSGIQDY